MLNWIEDNDKVSALIDAIDTKDINELKAILGVKDSLLEELNIPYLLSIAFDSYTRGDSLHGFQVYFKCKGDYLVTLGNSFVRVDYPEFDARTLPFMETTHG